VAGVSTPATLRAFSDRGAMSVEQQTGRDRVHQASRIVSVQADCTFAEAVLLMRDRAEVSQQPCGKSPMPPSNAESGSARSSAPKRA
jgi:hypothetical protein